MIKIKKTLINHSNFQINLMMLVNHTYKMEKEDRNLSQETVHLVVILKIGLFHYRKIKIK
jgi:hypothetical protein